MKKELKFKMVISGIFTLLLMAGLLLSFFNYLETPDGNMLFIMVLFFITSVIHICNIMSLERRIQSLN